MAAKKAPKAKKAAKKTAKKKAGKKKPKPKFKVVIETEDDQEVEAPTRRVPPKPKVGRPEIYTEELADEVCRLLWDSVGDDLPLSLRQICQLDGMPSMTTVCKWQKEKPEFAKQYARAREMRKDALVDRITTLTREARSHARGRVGTGEAGAKIQAIRLEVEALKWILSKEYSRNYGDNIKLEHGGEINSKHRVSEEDQEKILEACKSAAAVASQVQPPAALQDKA